MIRPGAEIGVTHVAVARQDAELVRVLPDVLSLVVPVWVVMHGYLRTSAGCRLLFDAIVTDMAPLLHDNAP